MGGDGKLPLSVHITCFYNNRKIFPIPRTSLPLRKPHQAALAPCRKRHLRFRSHVTGLKAQGALFLWSFIDQLMEFDLNYILYKQACLFIMYKDGFTGLMIQLGPLLIWNLESNL